MIAGASVFARGGEDAAAWQKAPRGGSAPVGPEVHAGDVENLA